MVICSCTVLDCLLKIDDIRKPAVCESNALRLLLAFDLELFLIRNELLCLGFFVDDGKISGAVDNGVEEFGERIQLVDA